MEKEIKGGRWANYFGQQSLKGTTKESNPWMIGDICHNDNDDKNHLHAFFSQKC